MLERLPILSSQGWAWGLFDLGHWSMVSCTFSALLPFAFSSVLFPGQNAPMSWAALSSAFTLLGAVFGPVIGTYADLTDRRKILMFLFMLAETISLVCLVTFYEYLPWFVAFLLLAVASVCYLLVMSLYNALLVFVENSDDVAQVSSWGAGMSNLGAAVLMSALGMLTLTPAAITPGYIVTCTSVACIWCLAFSIFLWIYFPEPVGGMKVISEHQGFGFRHVRDMVEDLGNNKELLKLIIALFVFNEASTTMYSVHLVYGVTLGIGDGTLFAAQVVNRYVGVVFAAGWGVSALKFSTRTNILLSVALTVVCCVLLAVMNTAWEYWLLSILLAGAGTGTFIFSRVLLADLTPAGKAAQNFGLLACVNKIAGFIGPSIYSACGYAFHSPRAGFFVMLIFAGLGMYLLVKVDLYKASTVAREECEEAIIEDQQTQRSLLQDAEQSQESLYQAEKKAGY